MNVSKLFLSKETFIVAEIAQNHDGSLGMCHAYIDALADVGVDAIKFQTHIAGSESTVDEKFRVEFTQQDLSRFDYWRRMEFTEAQWESLKRHADQRGVVFLSTPFSVDAVALLDRIGMSIYKVGSGDTLAEEMFASILSTGKPIILSTGMSTWAEIDNVVSRLRENDATFALMQCTSQYPTPLSGVGLNVLEEMSHRYGCRVGLSDHSGKPSASLAALARGYGLIEVHATFDRRLFGPDVVASLTVDEIAGIVKFARDLRAMDANPVDKDQMASRLESQKTLFGRSLALQYSLPAGHVLCAEDFAQKKPGGGIPWSAREDLIGRRLRNNVSANRLLRNEDID